MPECVSGKQGDLLGSRWARLTLWVGPWVLVIIAGATGNTTHTVLWTFAFTVAGGACVMNARRCGRRHCYYTGPLYLLAALASLLYGVGVLRLGASGWNWIVGVTAAASLLFCCVLEPLLGKYTVAR